MLNSNLPPKLLFSVRQEVQISSKITPNISKFTNFVMRAISVKNFTIGYTIGEFNLDSKTEYSAIFITRSQKKKLKQTTPVPL